MILWLHDMYLRLRFSPEVVKFLIIEQGLDSHERLRVLINKAARMPLKCPTGGNSFQSWHNRTCS